MRKHELRMAVYAFESSKNGESIFIISVGGKPLALRAEHCELAGAAVSLFGGLCFREFVERRKHIYYIRQRKVIGFTSWSTARLLAGVAVSLLVIVY